uniref:Connector enhancer of kinase suppressor of ras 2-like n=1 Tax=Phallusia mammillata TaxID=59560 RepID=A0A6F9D916_9ASCI|nr:connector enhancer of kinase suppressor of ras 2-like [Phallusia mammillata]
MRAIFEDNELSYESFVETFCNINRSDGDRSSESDFLGNQVSITEDEGSSNYETTSTKSLESNGKRHEREDTRSISEIPVSVNVGKASSTSSGLVGRRKKLRKVSIDKLTSFGEAVRSGVTSRKTKVPDREDQAFTPGTGDGRRMSTWLSNIPPYLARKWVADSETTSTDGEGGSSGSISSISSKSSAPLSKPSVFRIPATRLGAAAHRGYLDCRNKKKQWERFWCVLQDTCLYCYNTPQSDVTRDAVLLRGYDVVADVTNLNRTRFVFRLQQQGVPTLHFASDNHRDFLLWVGTLERETRQVTAHRNQTKSASTEEELLVAKKKVHRASMPALSQLSPSETNRMLRNSASQEKFDNELIQMQKQKLLQEISTQRQQIIEEQIILEKVASTTQLPNSNNQSASRRMSREEVIGHYERAKEEEELKVTKFLTLLNRRRNSVQLKADQCSKDLAPKSGRRRRDNHFQFSSMESRLKEMQETLSLIDKEFEEEEANKLHNLEKLQQKRDLELLILEQRETLDIMRRHKSKGMSHRRRRSLNDAASPSSARSVNTLGSIDELSSISDERMSSSTSTSSMSEANGNNLFPPTINSLSLRSMSTPLTCKKIFYEGPKSTPTRQFNTDVSSDADSGFQPSQVLDEFDSTTVDKTSRTLSEISSPRLPSDSNDEANTENNIATCSDGTPSGHSPDMVRPQGGNKDKEIASSVLEQIEDFEQFVKTKLEAKRNAT